MVTFLAGRASADIFILNYSASMKNFSRQVRRSTLAHKFPIYLSFSFLKEVYLIQVFVMIKISEELS